jgi:hypothetical protein
MNHTVIGGLLLLLVMGPRIAWEQQPSPPAASLKIGDDAPAFLRAIREIRGVFAFCFWFPMNAWGSFRGEFRGGGS